MGKWVKQNTRYLAPGHILALLALLFILAEPSHSHVHELHSHDHHGHEA